jgi:hypothetical protein
LALTLCDPSGFAALFQPHWNVDPDGFAEVSEHAGALSESM